MKSFKNIVYYVKNLDLESRIHSGLDFSREILETDFGRSVVVGFLNPYSYAFVAPNDNLCKGVDFWYSDGALLCMLLSIDGSKKYTRASFDFSSIGYDVLKFAERHDKRVAFIGGSALDSENAMVNIKNKFPCLNIVYSRDGYFGVSDSNQIISRISEVSPDYLIVGMGTPRQEEFAIKCKELFVHKCVVFTCGGFVTQTALRSDYYKPLIKKLGLRWLQRAIEFKHVRDRLFFHYPVFFVKYFGDVLKLKIKRIRKFLFN